MMRCTICGDTLAGKPDDDGCCADCAAANSPPPSDMPLPWWQAVRLRLAPNREGIRAMYRREESPHDATPP